MLFDGRVQQVPKMGLPEPELHLQSRYHPFEYCLQFLFDSSSIDILTDLSFSAASRTRRYSPGPLFGTVTVMTNFDKGLEGVSF